MFQSREPLDVKKIESDAGDKEDHYQGPGAFAKLSSVEVVSGDSPVKRNSTNAEEQESVVSQMPVETIDQRISQIQLQQHPSAIDERGRRLTEQTDDANIATR